MPEEIIPQPENEPDLSHPVDVLSGQNPETHAAPAASPGGSFTSGDWEALAELIEAKKDLHVAKRPFLDRLVLGALLPIALLIVGPWATWYFMDRAEEGLAEVRRANEGNEKLAEIVVALEATLRGAEKKITEMDRARANELAKMEKMVCALDDTMKNALIQMTVARIISERTSLRSMARPSQPGLQPSLEPEVPWLAKKPADTESTIDQADSVEIIGEAVEQLEMPGFDGEELRGRVKHVLNRMNARK